MLALKGRISKTPSQSPIIQNELTDPLVVWLVDVLVDAGVVLETVDPVDEEIGEEEIQRYAEHKVRPSVIRDVVVDHGMSSDLS